jgi:hypothetical protein
MTFNLNMWWLVGKNVKGNNFAFKSFLIATPQWGYVHKVMGFITWQILELLRLPWRNFRIFYHFDPTSITSHKYIIQTRMVNPFKTKLHLCELGCVWLSHAPFWFQFTSIIIFLYLCKLICFEFLLVNWS